MLQYPYHRTRTMPEPGTAEHVADTAKIRGSGVLQQVIVVAYLPKPYASGQEMALDMRELHDQGKGYALFF